MSARFGDERLPERFWDKVEPEPNTGCWLWTSTGVGQGYGGGTDRNKKYYAHRRAYEALVGPIPPGLQIDHKCRVRICCNPDHLEPVTCRENLLRGQTFTARLAARTHCDKGHPLDGLRNKRERVALGLPKFRYCLTCNRELQREIRGRRKNEQRSTRQAV